MSIPQQKFREAVFIALFSLDIGDSDQEALVDMIMRELKMTKKSVYEALGRAKLVLEKKEALDRSIQEASTGYEFERIPFVERNVLRLALFEMIDLPAAVAISEAIRLTRKFSTAEAASFINAILDNIYKHAEK